MEAASVVSISATILATQRGDLERYALAHGGMSLSQALRSVLSEYFVTPSHSAPVIPTDAATGLTNPAQTDEIESV